jgi:proteasome accessory factor A
MKRDFDSLASRLDWVLKLSVLQQVIDQNVALSWASPEIKHLDHLYASLDASEGLYWAYERGGLVERIVANEEIERFMTEPPEDTRAWTRAMILRHAGPDRVDDVDWDSIRLMTGAEPGRTTFRRLRMDSPLDLTKEASERAFRDAATLDELLDLIGSGDRAREQEKQKRYEST